MASNALDRLISVANLEAAWKKYYPRAKGSAAGIDGITPAQFDSSLAQQIRSIRDACTSGYTFSPLRGVAVPKSNPEKFRVICVPTMRDRLVQRALLRTIEERAARLRIANDVSFGFVKDTPTAKRGVAAARNAAIRHRQVKPWVFKTDITAFFDGIRRGDLIENFSRSFQLKSLTPLVAAAIACEVDTSDPRIRRILGENGIKTGQGLRQGMPLSPILSNFLLRDFDRAFMIAGHDLVRYADDLIVLASTFKECIEIEEMTRKELAKLGLGLSSDKTETRAPNEPVEFLGLELGIKTGTRTYSLTISTKQVAKIRDQFTQFHDVDFAVKEKLDLPKLLRRLENMKTGYRTAYSLTADNFGEIDQRLDQWADNCITKIYSSLFGAQALANLTSRHRQFLLLPHS